MCIAAIATIIGAAVVIAAIYITALCIAAIMTTIFATALHHCLRAGVYGWGVRAVRVISVMRIVHTANRNYMVMYMIGAVVAVKNMIGTMAVRTIPNWVVPPAPWGIIRHVCWSVNKPYRWPKPYIYHNAEWNSAVYGWATTTIGLFNFLLERFGDDLAAVQVFVTDNLKDSAFVTVFFNFDNGHILRFFFIQNGLKYHGVRFAFRAVNHAYIIGFSVFIKVQVIYLAVRCIQGFFKILQRSGGFK